VPSTLLLDQWQREAERELALLEPHIFLAGGGHVEWRKGSLLRVYTELGNAARLTIATIQTASTERFISRAAGGDHLLMVADEVHRLGSEKHRAVFEIESGARMGLSATPVRSRDPEGTAAIKKYFGEIVQPVVTLGDAIDAGRLCQYEYFVHLIDLTEEERDRYQELTTKIGQAFGAASNHLDSSEYLDHLLIQRAKVVKQASAKAPRAASLVQESFKDGAHWLVYCDDRRQVSDVVTRLREGGMDAFEYHSQMAGDRDATMDHFRRFGGVVVAIRCLDEGVDIPEITHAVVLASSRNSREFIQRRGRVLRVAPGKRLAVIHDLLVRPPPRIEGQAATPFAAIAESEVARAAEFARDAVNAGTRTALAALCVEWGIDPERLEEDDRDEED
jgi:superfamily II DNA or RNA helicase